jgi:hypothetical protein
VEGGEEELLADLVHLVADNGDDFIDASVPEEEVAIEACAELADVAGAEEELVAGDFGVGWSFAEGGNEELRPAMHGQRRHFPARCQKG